MRIAQKSMIAAAGFLALAMVFGFTMDAQAYRGSGHGSSKKKCKGHHRGGGMHGLNRMQYMLGLSDSQVKKIFDIRSSYREKFFDNRRNAIKQEALRKEMWQKIRNVLTKEQQKRWDEMHTRRQNRRGNGPRGVR